MDRRTFLNGLFGVVGGAVALTVATRAEALTPAHAPTPEPKTPEKAAKSADAAETATKLPEGADIQNVAWRRRTVYRRRVYRRPYRWRPRRRVCRVTRNRWGRVTRVCTY